LAGEINADGVGKSDDGEQQNVIAQVPVDDTLAAAETCALSSCVVCPDFLEV
jgi:hypothetical protein